MSGCWGVRLGDEGFRLHDGKTLHPFLIRLCFMETVRTEFLSPAPLSR